MTPIPAERLAVYALSGFRGYRNRADGRPPAFRAAQCLSPSADLAASTGYAMVFEPDAVRGLASNIHVGAHQAWSSARVPDDVAAPLATQFILSDNAKLAPITSELSITFKELIQAGSSAIWLKTTHSKVVEMDADTARSEAINDITAALDIGWSRGKMLYTVFGNLANKPLNDTTWGSTAKQFQNQLAVARYFTEDMAVDTTDLARLQGVLAAITPDTDVSTIDKIVQIIGTVPPGG